MFDFVNQDDKDLIDQVRSQANISHSQVAIRVAEIQHPLDRQQQINTLERISGRIRKYVFNQSLFAKLQSDMNGKSAIKKCWNTARMLLMTCPYVIEFEEAVDDPIALSASEVLIGSREFRKLSWMPRIIQLGMVLLPCIH